MKNHLWIAPVGRVIVARMRGQPDENLLRECQTQILNLVKETRSALVLHDCLEMEAPPIEVPLSQWRLDREETENAIRRAVVVPNTRLAYLARLAFADTHHRVFYNDLEAALNWLNETSTEFTDR